MGKMFKIFSVLLVTTALVVVGTGCGNKKDKDSNGGTASNSVEQEVVNFQRNLVGNALANLSDDKTLWDDVRTSAQPRSARMEMALSMDVDRTEDPEMQKFLDVFDKFVISGASITTPEGEVEQMVMDFTIATKQGDVSLNMAQDSEYTYMNLDSIPEALMTELEAPPEAGAMFTAFTNKWFKMENNFADSYLPADASLDAEDVSEEDIAKMKEFLEGGPIFANLKSAGTKNVEGVKVQCYSAEMGAEDIADLVVRIQEISDEQGATREEMIADMEGLESFNVGFCFDKAYMPYTFDMSVDMDIDEFAGSLEMNMKMWDYDKVKSLDIPNPAEVDNLEDLIGPLLGGGTAL